MRKKKTKDECKTNFWLADVLMSFFSKHVFYLTVVPYTDTSHKIFSFISAQIFISIRKRYMRDVHKHITMVKLFALFGTVNCVCVEQTKSWETFT